MIAWANFGVLVVSTLLTGYYYVKSVGPARLARRIGPSAYARCGRYRVVAGVFIIVATMNYVLYRFFPLPLPLPGNFPWVWWVSAAVAGAIALPAGYLFYRGVRDAGMETMLPKPEHRLYGGIYRKIRHPQALGEVPFWWVIALLLHSPALALYSIVWIPIFAVMCWAEDRDLVIRYGEEYEAYRKRTAALIPGIW